MDFPVGVGRGDADAPIIRTFNILELATTARFKVEKIVSEFRKAGEKGPKEDESDWTRRIPELLNIQSKRS